MTIIVRWALPVFGLALLVPPARAADLDPFVPADSEWVLHVNVKQLVASPVARKAGDQLQFALRSHRDGLAPLTELGVDPLKDVDTLCVAGSGLLQYDRAVLIAHGGFDPEKLRRAAEEQVKKDSSLWKVHQQGAVTFYELRDKARPQPLFFVLRDDATLLASPGKKYVLAAAAVDPKKPPKVSAPCKPRWRRPTRRTTCGWPRSCQTRSASCWPRMPPRRGSPTR